MSRAVGAWSPRRSLLLLAVLSFGPVWWSSPGKVGADTKQYLYLDPGELLSRAPYLWDAHVGFGTVTHQNIGYLWPMGPWSWVWDTVGVPDWVAQRLWFGLLFFVAGTGARFLGRRLGLDEVGALVAGVAFAANPLSLVYLTRISALLMPWAALPWMVAIVRRALLDADTRPEPDAGRTGRSSRALARWAAPAGFALVVTTVGSVNATALLYAGIGPVLWVLWAAGPAREVSVRAAVRVCLRVVALLAVTQLWWITGLVTQARYGLPILDYTETVETVSSTSTATEVLRGLGNWFFYGRDQLGPWIEPSDAYTQHLWLIVLSLGVPTLALLAAGLVRWRARGFAVLLVLVGLVLAVGTYPHDDPPPLGRLFQAVAARSTFGLALRSSPRAVPLLALGVALLLGAGVVALRGWLASARRPPRGAPRWRSVVAVGAVVLCALVLWPAWTGDLVGANLRRPEAVPSWWQETADHLDAHDDGTRALELPGSDFAAYRWGNAVDPVTPGLTDRPWAARELVPSGSPASADLLMALDRRMQEGVLDVDAIAPVARLLGVGEIVLRSDLEYERYRTPRPRGTWAALLGAAGLGEPEPFGPTTPNVPRDDVLLDEQELAVPTGAPDPPRVAVFGVDDARPIVRAEPVAATTVLAGDGEGIVEAAAAGLIDGSGPVVYAATLAAEGAEAQRAAVDPDAMFVITDTNRRAATRWGTVRENEGAVEQQGEVALREDEGDARLDVFPGSDDDARTVAEHRGVDGVRATRYGNTVSYTPEDRAVLALDGDLTTAWREGGLGSALGERLRVDLAAAAGVVVDHVVLWQPQEPANRWITRITLRLEAVDGSVEELAADLGDGSRGPEGQRVDFASRPLAAVEVRVDATDVGELAEYVGFAPVGLAELAIGDPGAVVADEVLRVPVDVLGLPGVGDASHPLAYVFARLRTDPSEQVRSDPERSMARSFSLPGAERSFAVGGEARISASTPDDAVDALVGMPGPAQGGVRATSSDRLPGSLAARASSAVDGDPATWWSPGFGDQPGRWLEVEAGAPVTVDHLDLVVVADGRHSVPTRLALSADDGPPVVVDVPAVADAPRGRATEGTTATVRVDVPVPVTATRLRVTVDDARVATTDEYFSRTPRTLPVGIAELGAEGFAAGAATGVDTGCRADVLTVDGEPVPVRVTGTAADAVARAGLAVEGCGPRALVSGDHLLRTAPGRGTGIDVDRVVLSSGAGGGGATVAGLAAAAAAARGEAPAVEVLDEGPVSATVRVGSVDRPTWLVLGQSHSDGWRAEVDGRSLGDPVLVDGFANGWLLQPSDGPAVVELTWAPQRLVWVGLAVSAVAVAACAAAVLAALARRREVLGVAGPAVAPWPAPVGTAPWRWPGEPPAAGSAVAVVVGAGVAGALVLGVLAGALLGAVAAVGVRARRSRLLLAAGPAVTLVLVGGYVAAKQLFAGYRPQFAWPEQFAAAHRWAFLAVLLAALEGVVAATWDRRRDAVSPGPGPAGAGDG